MKKALILFALLALPFQASAEMHNMTVTAFTLSAKETGGRTRHTSIMTKPVPGWTMAISRDKMKYLGKKAYIDGFGVGRIESVMRKGVKNTVDVLVGSKAQAKKIGRSKRKVVIL